MWISKSFNRILQMQILLITTFASAFSLPLYKNSLVQNLGRSSSLNSSGQTTQDNQDPSCVGCQLQKGKLKNSEHFEGDSKLETEIPL